MSWAGVALSAAAISNFAQSLDWTVLANAQRAVAASIESYDLLTGPAFAFVQRTAAPVVVVERSYFNLLVLSVFFTGVFGRSYVSRGGRLRVQDGAFLAVSSFFLVGIVILAGSVARTMRSLLRRDKEALAEESGMLFSAMLVAAGAVGFVLLQVMRK